MQLEIMLVLEIGSNRLSYKIHDLLAKMGGRNSTVDEELQTIYDCERESINLS